MRVNSLFYTIIGLVQVLFINPIYEWNFKNILIGGKLSHEIIFIIPGFLFLSIPLTYIIRCLFGKKDRQKAA